jgi:hypothetical protein
MKLSINAQGGTPYGKQIADDHNTTAIHFDHVELVVRKI